MKRGPGNDGGWARDKLCSGQLPDNRLTDRLLPPRFGLAVIHDQIAEAQAPGGAEVQHTPIDGALESKRCIAQRAERHGNGYSSNGIVHNLVPDENLKGYARASLPT